MADIQCDVLILDYNSIHSTVEQQLEIVDEHRNSPVPVVVMTDDDKRSTAIELVQRGVYDYVRKPPSIPELKIIFRRAHEHAGVQRELEFGPIGSRGSSPNLGRNQGRAKPVY